MQRTSEPTDWSFGGLIVGPELRCGVQGPVLRLVFVAAKLSAGL
jgi:hypothetical protein